MAVKAVCKVDVLAPSSNVPGAFHIIIGFAGLEPGNTAAGSITLLDQPPDLTSVELVSAIKDYLVQTYGYIFEPQDVIRFFGQLE